MVDQPLSGHAPAQRQPHGSELIIAPWTAMIHNAQPFGHYRYKLRMTFLHQMLFQDLQPATGDHVYLPTTHYAAGTIHKDRPCLHISMYTSTVCRHRPNAFRSVSVSQSVRMPGSWHKCMAGYSSPMQGSHTGSGVPSRSVPLGSPLAAKLVQYSPIRLARS